MDIFENPLEDSTITQLTEPCILVIFGATGDLTARRLVPSLYTLAYEGLLPSQFACVGFARREKTHEQFREEMVKAISEHARNKEIDQGIWQSFSEQLFYHRSEFEDDDGYLRLQKFLTELDGRFGTKGNRIYYLSTPPSHFARIVHKLDQHQLIYPMNSHSTKFSRVVIEKPFGHDYTSALELQEQMNLALDEKQIFRIDHWLGKETVQNLLVLRFANSIFEALWNNQHIDHVQITVSEEEGVGTRGKHFEEAGTLRDILQNHMMQLLSLVAMEPPINLNADSIRDEKVKVLSSIRPIPQDQVDNFAVRGQYGPGFMHGKSVPGYREEANVSPTSNVETFVALELFIDNWRWAGVPFFLRTGRRLPKRATEIAIFFKEPPRVLFNTMNAHSQNALVIRIQPDEGLSLKISSKIPGSGLLIQPVKLDFKYSSHFGTASPEAYERLLCDAMIGDSTLFTRQDEVLIAWKLLDPILKQWKKPTAQLPNYLSGSWGPKEATAMIEKEGRKWRLL